LENLTDQPLILMSTDVIPVAMASDAMMDMP
jgi:hypothetical protein